MIVFRAQVGEADAAFHLHVPVAAEHEGIAVGYARRYGVAVEVMILVPQIVGCRRCRQGDEVTGHRAVEPVPQFRLDTQVGELQIGHRQVGGIGRYPQLQCET